MTATLTVEQARRILADAARFRERALTLRQPWPDLVMAGVKDVENRTWPVPSTLPQWMVYVEPDGTEHRERDPERSIWPGWRPDGPFPFRLWVHAGREWDRAWKREILAPGAYVLRHETYGRHRWLTARSMGALLGYVTVTGCHHADDCEHYKPDHHCSRWAEPDVWHWTLTDPVPLPEPIPMRGRQGLWRLSEEVAA